MLFKHCILKHFKFEPTQDQKAFIDLFSSFMTKRESHKTFLLKGYAGTGKTTLVSALVKTCKELNIPIILLAPTGRAAKVLGNYSSAPASTIHRAIYHKKTMDIASNFVLGFNKISNALFVVDEASMINTASVRSRSRSSLPYNPRWLRSIRHEPQLHSHCSPYRRS